ncbi:ABC transporter ATP-binding protein, partial [Citrobacter portucalensis]|nr:ABC transporter ATP-binding protein [Citrobacter portucalensis]
SVVRVEPNGAVSQGLPEQQLATDRLAALYRVTPSQIAHHLFGCTHCT